MTEELINEYTNPSPLPNNHQDIYGSSLGKLPDTLDGSQENYRKEKALNTIETNTKAEWHERASR